MTKSARLTVGERQIDLRAIAGDVNDLTINNEPRLARASGVVFQLIGDQRGKRRTTKKTQIGDPSSSIG